MRKSFLAVAIILATSFSVSAGGKNTNNSIKGTVVDSNQEAIAGALVSIEGLNQKVYTDLDGHFEIENIGADAINISFVSFEDKNVSLESNTTDLTIVLEEK